MIAAVDGASTDLSLALADRAGDVLADERWTSPQRQSAELLPRLLALLSQRDGRLADLTAIAVGTGPGSFTGLRVAMALGKGLAFGLGIPIVGVPSLESWLAADPGAEAAVARAGAREAYVQLRGAEDPLVADRDGLTHLLLDRQVVAPAEVSAAFGLPRSRPPHAAAAMASRAARQLAEDPSGDDLAGLEPRYLRGPRGLATQPEGAVRWL